MSLLGPELILGGIIIDQTAILSYSKEFRANLTVDRTDYGNMLVRANSVLRPLRTMSADLLLTNAQHNSLLAIAKLNHDALSPSNNNRTSQVYIDLVDNRLKDKLGVAGSFQFVSYKVIIESYSYVHIPNEGMYRSQIKLNEVLIS